jgi:hypothetical protein
MLSWAIFNEILALYREHSTASKSCKDRSGSTTRSLSPLQLATWRSNPIPAKTIEAKRRRK